MRPEGPLQVTRVYGHSHEFLAGRAWASQCPISPPWRSEAAQTTVNLLKSRTISRWPRRAVLFS